jgi:hypothetical protein
MYVTPSTKSKVEGVAQVIECLSSKHEAMSSNPVPLKEINFFFKEPGLET